MSEILYTDDVSIDLQRYIEVLYTSEELIDLFREKRFDGSHDNMISDIVILAMYMNMRKLVLEMYNSFEYVSNSTLNVVY
ncbi:hypothetical protein [Paenibacillus vini]|uniref:Transposase n=1 Tax=Paenibacillus vini TaxID=1476024 RepID=A0ABQ4MA46_9BACL|nr:hypothetical protein [Paenibacillus vini]GIP52864.1 hypothetical protein J42TS3_18990 [Paenibacillus vini]